MAKEKKPNIPKPIHFPHDWDNSGALKRFKEACDKGCFHEVYLIQSQHWLAAGFWILFEKPELTHFEKLLGEHHDANPKPWTYSVPKNKPRDDDDDEEYDDE